MFKNMCHEILKSHEIVKRIRQYMMLIVYLKMFNVHYTNGQRVLGQIFNMYL